MSKRMAALVASNTPELKSLRMLRTKSGGRRWMSCFFARRTASTHSCAFGNLPLWGRCPQTPGVYRIRPMGSLLESTVARSNPRHGAEASAPLATSTAPVALRQSRILRTMLNPQSESAQYQSLPTLPLRSPVLLRLRCLVLNRLCLVLLRPRQKK
jgi:hypothetical protein